MPPSKAPTAADRILEDLAPVRRLARPWRRTLPVALLAALVAAAVYRGFGVRRDAVLLGAGVLWGLSAAQVACGLLLVGSALRTAVPGRGRVEQLAAWLLLGSGALIAVVTWITWMAHPTHVPHGAETLYWGVCTRTPLLLGLPALALTLVLAFRAYPTRPLLTGALAGLGAGLLSDGSWRTYCEVSDPAHVLTSHAAAVVLLTLGGMLGAWLVARRRAAEVATLSVPGPR